MAIELFFILRIIFIGSAIYLIYSFLDYILTKDKKQSRKSYRLPKPKDESWE